MQEELPNLKTNTKFHFEEILSFTRRKCKVSCGNQRNQVMKHFVAHFSENVPFVQSWQRGA